MPYSLTRARRRIISLTFLLLSTLVCAFNLPASFQNQLELTAHAATFVVTNTNDSGPGSLRAAIESVNETAETEINRVTFNIPDGSPPSVKTIQLAAPLPVIIRKVEIDGLSQGGQVTPPGPLILLDGSNAGTGATGLTIAAGQSEVKGLAFTGFSGSGILLKTKGGNHIERNIFGPSAGATTPPESIGISVEADSPGNTIDHNESSRHTDKGLDIHSDSNTINDNRLEMNSRAGIVLNGSSNQVYSNFLSFNGKTAQLPRGGVLIDGSNNNLFNNQINVNIGSGIAVSSGVGNYITANSLFQNNGLGIDLKGDNITPNDTGDADTGPNNLQNFPVITSASGGPGLSASVTGTINSTPHTTLRIEFYANPECSPSGYGYGKRYLGDFTAQTVTTDSNGNATFAASNLSASPPEFIAATATDTAHNTSEFSQCRFVESSGVLRFKSLDFSFNENAGTANITVERFSGGQGTISIDYTTEGGTATGGADYAATSGTLTFAPNEFVKTLSIPLADDTMIEGTEFVNLRLSNPQNTSLDSFHSLARLVIFDNESLRPPDILGLADHGILRFNSDAPGETLADVLPIGGFAPGEFLISIAFRPLNGKLYGLTSQRRLFTINTVTGDAQAVNSTPFEPTSLYTAAMSFNPVTDRLRVVTREGRNFQLNPDTGQIVSEDGPLAFAPGDSNTGDGPHVVSLANDNNFTGATQTTTYGINYWSSLFYYPITLVRLGSIGGKPVSPDTGQVFTVQPVAGVTEEFRGFDIGDNNIGYTIINRNEAGLLVLRKLFASGALAEDFRMERAGITTITDLAVVPSAHVQFRYDQYNVNENEGTATITVRRTGNTDVLATVNYATSDGTATAGLDYLPASGTLSFAYGETIKTFTVKILNDAVIEGVETVKLQLSNAGNSVLSPQTTATLAIMDEATEAGTNPIDNAQFFVRQHYLDFLGREPDDGGLGFWTSNITRCGSDSLCIHERRIGTSAAFFIENEFQQTGSFIYRLYKAALGRKPNFSEFNADRSQVVGGAGLDANKATFADGFVQRTELTQKYQANTTAESFVDALIATIKSSSGADLSGQRAALINTYNAGGSMTQSRSQVVRAAIEDASFKQAEYNPSFVLMQYLGYLRRDPELGGYLFWLNVLNNKEPNNYRGMVCAFITSAEYQHRFSTITTRSNQECK